MNVSMTLAMRVYSSWTERVFSLDGLESLFNLGMFAAAIAVLLLARRRPAASPYFSGVFALGLCPLLFASVVAMLRIHSLFAYEDQTPDYVAQRLQYPVKLLIFGGALSASSLVIYTIICAATRRTAQLRSLVPSPPAAEHQSSDGSPA